MRHGIPRRDDGGADRQVAGAGPRVDRGARRDRGTGRETGGAARLRRAHARARPSLPEVRLRPRRLRHARAHVAPPGHLAVQDLHPLPAAPPGLPGRARHGRGPVGIAAVKALHRPVRGPGAADGDVVHASQGHSEARARERHEGVGDAQQDRRRGALARRLLRRDAGRGRRDGPQARPQLHLDLRGPRRRARSPRSSRRTGETRRPSRS